MSGVLHSTGSTNVSFALMLFAPHRNIVHHVAIIPDNDNANKRNDMIIGRDLIKSLGLVLDYSTDTPSITGRESQYLLHHMGTGPKDW
jgi:hypothetical protein